MTATTALDQARQEKNAWKARAQIAEADRDRARTIAVALEQENARLHQTMDRIQGWLADQDADAGDLADVVAERGQR